MAGKILYLYLILLSIEGYILNEYSTIRYFLPLPFYYGSHLSFYIWLNLQMKFEAEKKKKTEVWTHMLILNRN